MLQSAARRLSRQLSARLWHLESRNCAMCMTSSSSGNWTQVEQDDDSDSDSAAALRLRLLDAALPHVSVHGWSVAALHAGARDLSLSPAVVGVLPRGAAQLAEHAVAAANAALAARLAAASPALSALPLRDALLIGLRTRLELVAPHITAGTWPQAMALLSSSPSSSAASLVLLGQLVDEVLHAAGDMSSDMTWCGCGRVGDMQTHHLPRCSASGQAGRQAGRQSPAQNAVHYWGL